MFFLWFHASELLPFPRRCRPNGQREGWSESSVLQVPGVWVIVRVVMSNCIHQLTNSTNYRWETISLCLKCLIWACLLISSEKRITQNVLRIFLDPLLDALMKLGTNAYMPLLKTDRCLQLLLKLLHTCLFKGSSTQDGEDKQFLCVSYLVYCQYLE